MIDLKAILIFVSLTIGFFRPESIFCQIVRNTPDTVTVYTYRLKGKTATGALTNKIKEPFLAISRDLLKNYPLHSKVILYNCMWEGTYKVMDIMAARHKHTVDIFYKGKKKTNKKKCLCTLSFN